MKISVEEADWRSIECDALLLTVFEDDFAGQLDGLSEDLSGLLTEMADAGELLGKMGERVTIHRPEGIPARRLILLGAGKRCDYKTAVIRKTITDALRKLKGYRLSRLAVARRSDVDAAAAAQAAVEGIVLGNWDLDEYKTQGKSVRRIEEIVFVAPPGTDLPSVHKALRRGQILAEATNLTRSLVNEPGNLFTPTRLADKARDVAQRVGLEVEILEDPDLDDLGMHALLAVGRGSDEPSRLIVLRHRGADDPDAAPIVLVGKGVTFDSGGISLKPPTRMEEMKADKAGACAVLGAMQAVAQLQVRQNIVGLMPSVENLPSGRAQRPGDVVRSYSGKTIEVINTDAEGRLILADALHYACQMNPRFIVDLATLTGACVVALGHVRAGAFCNDDELFGALDRASVRAGEKLWRLPLDPEFRKELDSDIADIKNVGDRWGGAITAAKFLEEFVSDTPWAHLDIAGVDLFKERGVNLGPTGFGVRTLVELVDRAEELE